MSELTDHLEGMADSLDEVVTHEDIHRLLIEALTMSREQDDRQRPAPLLTTAAALDELEPGSIVRGTVNYEALGGGRWHAPGSARIHQTSAIHLPAAIIFAVGRGGR